METSDGYYIESCVSVSSFIGNCFGNVGGMEINRPGSLKASVIFKLV